MVSIYNYWKEGNIEKANESQKKIRAFRNVMQMGNPNSVVKLAVNMRGYHVGPARQPSELHRIRLLKKRWKMFSNCNE